MSEIINLNNSTPAAPTGNANITWQKGAASGVDANGNPIYPVSAYVDASGGGVGGSIIPALSSWTSVNQGPATAVQTVSSGPILLTVPQNGSPNWRLLTMAVPATPYKVKAQLAIGMTSVANSQAAGVYFYDGTRLLGVELLLQAAGYETRCEKMAGVQTDSGTCWSPPGQSSNALAVLANLFTFPGPVWLQLRNDGTQLYFDLSLDGANFVNFYTIGLTAWLTPTAIGFGGICITSSGADYIAVDLLSWQVSANASL